MTCLLLVKTGHKPRSHNLKSLEQLAFNKIKEFNLVFPNETDRQKTLFDTLNAAYIDSRYKMHFKISKEDLIWLEQHVFRLKAIVNQLCKEEGIITELLDAVPDDKTSEEFMTELEASWEESDRKELALQTIRSYRDEGFQLGERSGLEKGKAEGYQQGEKEGKEKGFQLGEQSGLEKGKAEGKTEGYQLGEKDGIEKGKTQGLLIGKAMGKEEGFRLGEKNGLQKGKTQGYKLGKEEGKTEGYHLGEQQKTLQIAKTMKEKGMNLQLIAEISGLSLNTIKRL